MTDRPTRIAVCQTPSWPDDPGRTWAAIDDALAQATSAGAALTVLPELCTTGSSLTATEAEALAEPVDGATVRRLADWSARTRSVLVAGWAERHPGGLAPYNSAVLLDSGEISAVYRKTHLWDREKLLFTPGAAPPPVIGCSAGRVGIAICYDAEIPELTRGLAAGGAQLIAVPANWPRLGHPAGQLPVEIAKAQAAAAANKVAVAIADRCGSDRGQTWTAGSVIIGVRGYRSAGPVLDRAAVHTAELTLTDADDKSLGEHNDAFTDLRPELYPVTGPATL